MDNQAFPPQPPPSFSYSHNDKAKINVWRIITIILFVVLLGVGGIYLFNSQNQKSILRSTQQFTSSLEPTNFNSQEGTNNQRVIPPVPDKSTKENKLAMEKNEQVVIKNLTSNEEIATGIPIKWEDPNATWCGGFDWSSDGSKLIVPTLNKIFDVQTKNLQDIPKLEGRTIPWASFQWNPTGNSLYYNRDGSTWLFDFDTFDSKQIASHPMAVTNRTHSVSPDGKKIILYRNSDNRNPFVFDLINRSEININRPPDANRTELIVMDFSWAPSSDEIAFVYHLEKNTNTQIPPRTIGIFNLNTRQSKRLFSFSFVRGPQYSPDGEYILFENEEGPQELWQIDRNGSNPIKLSEKHIGSYMTANWSTNNQKIVFSKLDEGVILIDKDGHNKQIIDSKADCPIWSP